MASTNGYTPSDIALGKMIQKIRCNQGLTLMQLGKKTNDLYQQVEKYEKGLRIPVVKLEEIADALDIFVPKKIIRKIVLYRKKGCEEYSSELIALYADIMREENGY